MWEKIAKEMQLPWRAAEAMHWQIGEVEMAQRANVPVFHLAGQQPSQAGAAADRTGSVSPSSATGPPSTMPYPQLHSHSLPQISMAQSQSLSPVETRLRSNSIGGGSVPMPPALMRRRADSARAVPTVSTLGNRTFLPPVGELTAASGPLHYTLPPVVSSPETSRR